MPIIIVILLTLLFVGLVPWAFPFILTSIGLALLVLSSLGLTLGIVLVGAVIWSVCFVPERPKTTIELLQSKQEELGPVKVCRHCQFEVKLNEGICHNCGCTSFKII